MPEHIGSSEPTELLGELLVANGSITDEDVAEALVEISRRGGRIGDWLVRSGKLSADELLLALREQLELRWLELFALREGESVFLRGERAHSARLPFQPSVLSLTARGIREHYGQDELDELLRFADSAALRPVAGVSQWIGLCGLEPAEERVLGLIDQPLRLQSLLARRSADLSRLVVMQAVFFGLSVGLLQSEGFQPFLPLPTGRLPSLRAG